GAARRALDRTLAYSVAREQFGRPIGSFQAYKHRCASAFVELKLAQSLAFRAADEIDTDPAQALAAGLYSTSAAVRVCGEAIQLHGGIGFSWEAGLHALLKRARMDQLLAKGGAATARALLAAAV
ncbi:MAG TPA: acyl-CoA dehydrogenase family protein, partial [Vicinamibacterales bacterium]